METGKQKVRGIAIDDFISLGFTKEGVVIFTDTGYHLTIYHQDSRGRINLHLTREPTSSSPKQKIAETYVYIEPAKEFIVHLISEMFSTIKKVRVEELHRKGFVVFYDEKERLEGLINHHSPVRKKRIRPDIGSMQKGFVDLAASEQVLYNPRILYNSSTKTDRPISAQVYGRSKKAPARTLFYLFPNPSFSTIKAGWYYLDTAKFTHVIDKYKAELEDLYGEFFKKVDEVLGFKQVIERLIEKYSANYKDLLRSYEF